MTDSLKLDILAIGAHPDDVELSAAGTIARHVQQGRKVGVLDLTRGELGTRGSAELRDEEAARAAQILGLSMRHNLNLGDGFFQVNRENQVAIIRVLRKYQPEIVLLNAPHDRHIDHGRGSQLAAEACFLSGLRKIETEWEGVAQAAWRPKTVYRYIQDYYLKPDLVVDITDFWDRKLESIRAYSSQFHDPDSTEPQTPISSPEFMEFIQSRAVAFGRTIGVRYGEGFVVDRPVGTDDLFDLL